jgi:hypothetical protein
MKRFSLLEVTFRVKQQTKKQRKYPEIYAENLENALLDYEDASERTAMGEYRCRDCGVVFDTLEAHDFHLRSIHGRAEVIPLVGMQM